MQPEAARPVARPDTSGARPQASGPAKPGALPEGGQMRLVCQATSELTFSSALQASLRTQMQTPRPEAWRRPSRLQSWTTTAS